MYNFEEKFTQIVEKMKNDENISTDLNEIMNETKSLKNEYEMKLNEINEKNKKIEELKDANCKLLLTKAFIGKSFDDEPVEQEKKYNMKDYISFK